MIDFENIQTRSTLQPKIKEISFTACKCNGWSTRCGFNEEYFLATGSGGECINCEGNRDGQHCERCLPDHYESPEQDQLNRTSCLACNCDPTGMYVYTNQGQNHLSANFVKSTFPNLSIFIGLYNN